jgi:transcriptional regulator GlxA family with amidase domain
LIYVETPLSLAQMAAQVGIGQRRLARQFVRHVGIPPHRYYTRIRLARAKELLQHGGLGVSEVALAAGFVSSAHFARAYRARYGRRPSADRPA